MGIIDDIDLSEIYIFGAHSRGSTLAVYLSYLFNSKIIAFLFDNEESNPEKIMDSPVVKISSVNELDTNIPVFIATRGVYWNKIEDNLEKAGFRNIFFITPELDSDLRTRYFKKYFHGLNRSFEKIDEFSKNDVLTANDITASVYVAKSVFDKALSEIYVPAKFEKTIQVGSALTEIRLPDVDEFDDVGDNISRKNKQYCELTALYWIWKNAKDDIIGLSHYRRHFLLPENWSSIMLKNNIDVILPVPLCVYPSVAENFIKRHDGDIWMTVLKLLSKYSDFKYDKCIDYFKNKYYCPCNMFIVKKEVLTELCEWLFNLLDDLALIIGQKEDKYLNRYPGFVSERLISMFFEVNSNRFKIAYADKNFLS